MKKLIIAANLGQIRVLRYQHAGEDPIEQAHLIEEPGQSCKLHVNGIRDTVTDQAGRFGQGSRVGTRGGMSYGEGHNLKEELERDAMKSIAARIDKILAAEGLPTWILTAPQSILARLQQALALPTRQVLASSVGADLTHCPLPEMEQRFL